MRILTFLLLMVIGAGQAWADEVTVGHITYTKGADDHGVLTFHHNHSNANQGSTPITVGADLTPSSYYSATTINEAVKDDNNNIIGYKVYIHAVPDFGYALGDTDVDNNQPVSFIQAEVVTQEQQAPGRRTLEVGQKVEVYKWYNGVYYFTLPADPALSVRVTATFPVKAKNTEAISYIGANGTATTLPANTAYVLDGTEGDYPILGNPEANSDATWYVLTATNASYGSIYLAGNVNLILANGAQIYADFYGTADRNGQGTPHNLAIYGQSRQYVTQGNPTTTDCGRISLGSEGFHAFDNLAIYGGHFISESSLIGGVNTLTMAGGRVEWNYYDDTAIAISATTFNYTGGQFALNCGISADAVTLGWSRADDYFQAGSYNVNESLTIAQGQRFVAYNMDDDDDISASAIVSGTIDYYERTNLAGKTLKPLDGYVVTTPAEVTAKSSPDFTISNTHYYIYKSNDPVTLSYTGSGIVQVTGLPEGYAAVENQPMQRQFTMPATDVALTNTAVTGLTATPVTYDGTARTPEVKQGEDVFDAANYVIAYKQGENAVTEAKNVGTYTCTMTGLGQYIGTTTVPFAINLRSTSLAVEIVDPVTTIDGHPILISGDDAHVKVTLNPVREENETTELPKINGIATIIMTIGEDDKPYTVAIVNGEGHYYVSNLGQGAYDITASFAGDANHAASTSDPNYSIAVSNVKTALRICFDKTDMTANTKVVTVGEPVTVYVDLYTVPSDWDGDFAKASPFNSDAVLTVKCNPTWQTDTTGHGNYTVGLVNGHGSITFSHLAADECHYNIDAVYAGNDKYLQCQTMNGTEPGRKTLIMTVNKTATTVGVGVTSPVIAKEQNYE